MGAWIETPAPVAIGVGTRSPPAWGRGLLRGSPDPLALAPKGSELGAKSLRDIGQNLRRPRRRFRNAGGFFAVALVLRSSPYENEAGWIAARLLRGPYSCSSRGSASGITLCVGPSARRSFVIDESMAGQEPRNETASVACSMFEYGGRACRSPRIGGLTRLLHERCSAHAISASAALRCAAEVSAHCFAVCSRLALRRAERVILSKPRSSAARRSPEGAYCTGTRAICGLMLWRAALR